MSIVEELRAKKSRDNRELLDRAAAEIEDLDRNLVAAYKKIEEMEKMQNAKCKMQNREKQIEEMVKIIEQAKHDMWVGECPTYAEHSKNIAKYLYAAGYRKQSEWISVEERLPEVDTNVLVITANGSFKVARCNIYHNGTLVLWMTNDGLGERAITHWMPLPEAPKMKGGAE